MTAKGVRLKKGRIESEVEKLRSEGNWVKAIEIIAPHRSDPNLSCLFQLVSGEQKLECFEGEFLNDCDINEANICLEEAIKTCDEQYRLEVMVLQGKLKFIKKSFTAVLDSLQSLHLLEIQIENYSSRFARIVSEGIALIGLCIEELSLLTRRTLSEEQKNDACHHFDVAGEICIHHFQRLYQEITDPNMTITFPKLVFRGIQRSVAINQQSGNIRSTVSKYRYLLRFIEVLATKNLRQSLTYQFAEFLLRGLCITSYRKYDLVETENELRLRKWKPLPYRYPANRPIPDGIYREAILMLLMSEHVASQGVILTRPSDESEARFMQSFNKVSAVYDLLTIALARTRNFPLLTRTLERSLKFSYREYHIWYQFALSLISSRKYYRAYLVLRECLRLDSTKLSPYILATSLCFGHLGLIEDGMELASKAVEIASNDLDTALCARTHLLLGWGFSLLARTCCVVDQKRDLQNQAIAEYTAATQLDPEDYMAWYHLAVELATQRHLDDALVACQSSLRLTASGDTNTLCLLALMHTTGTKRLDQAIRVVTVGLSDKPRDFSLLFLLARLEAVRHNPKAGLRIYRRLLEVWRDNFHGQRDNVVSVGRVSISRPDSTGSGALGVLGDQLTLDLEDEETLPQRWGFPQQISGDQYLTNALTDMAHGLLGRTGSSITPVKHRYHPQQLPGNASPSSMVSAEIQLQAKIYHGMIELYLADNQLGEAQDALDEAVRIAGLHVDTLYLRGCLAEKQGIPQKARSLYEAVISIKSTHVPAMLGLAKLLHQNQQAPLAERVIRDAVNTDPTSSQAWYLLSEILTESSVLESASEGAVTRALFNATELEQTEPLEPFYALPIGVHCV